MNQSSSGARTRLRKVSPTHILNEAAQGCTSRAKVMGHSVALWLQAALGADRERNAVNQHNVCDSSSSGAKLRCTNVFAQPLSDCQQHGCHHERGSRCCSGAHPGSEHSSDSAWPFSLSALKGETRRDLGGPIYLKLIYDTLGSYSRCF